ncbi:MAG: hypothetical protein NC089_01155 [Bacteroides sp.]|nr:hypothetical protein [Bacteroides sp.]MCM1549821.1 hypothetical protein [Clostridium sp.]
MDFSKEKCKVLKKIRKKLADTLEIDLHQRECTYEGACSGTCPKCKQEEEQLNRALLAKTALAAGTVATVAGLTGCTQMYRYETEGDAERVMPSSAVEELEGIALEGNPLEESSEEQKDAATEKRTEEQEPGRTEEETEAVSTAEPVTGEILEEETEEVYELEGDIDMPEPGREE